MNGKLPTQDLGAWIRGSDLYADKLIPPLKKLPEITLGESDTKEGEYRRYPSYLYGFDIDTPSGIDETADDPDILAVCFQELDLSAGALLYTTEPLREDAWTSAVLAGLGEKLELYNKVSPDGCFSLKVNEMLSILSRSGSWPLSNWSECSSWYSSRKA